MRRSASLTQLPAPLYLATSMALVGSYVGLSKAMVLVFPVFLLTGLRFGGIDCHVQVS